MQVSVLLEKLQDGHELATVGDLYALELSTLEDHFGSYGLRLYQLARGIDHNPVVPNRVSKSISAEDTFPEDIPPVDTESQIRRLDEKVRKSSHGNARAAKTVVLKLKTKEFNSHAKPHTSGSALILRRTCKYHSRYANGLSWDQSSSSVWLGLALVTFKQSRNRLRLFSSRSLCCRHFGPTLWLRDEVEARLKHIIAVTPKAEPLYSHP